MPHVQQDKLEEAKSEATKGLPDDVADQIKASMDTWAHNAAKENEPEQLEFAEMESVKTREAEPFFTMTVTGYYTCPHTDTLLDQLLETDLPEHIKEMLRVREGEHNEHLDDRLEAVWLSGHPCWLGWQDGLFRIEAGLLRLLVPDAMPEKQWRELFNAADDLVEVKKLRSRGILGKGKKR